MFALRNSGLRLATRLPRRRILGGPRQFSTAPAPASRYGALLLVGGLSAFAGWYSASSPPDTASTTRLDELDSPRYASAAELAKAVEEITRIVGPENVSTSASELLNHSDNSSNFHKPSENERPDIVAYPGSVDEVSAVVKVCYKYRVPMVPYSGGTSIEGHFIPTRRGVCIDVSRLDKVVALHEEDLDLVVQPGVGWQELGEFLEPYGLMFGPDPGPGAMIGGMVATSCSGTNASRYGTMKENVISLKVVLADGTVVKTKNRPRKSSSGYNLTGLFVGSEGTLGIVVEATLKLHVRPQNEVVAIVNFDTVKDAAKTVTDVFRRGIQVNAVELMDDRQMKCFAEMGGDGSRTWSDKNLLLFKVAGSQHGLQDNLDEITRICKANRGFNIEIASDQDEKDAIWRARKTQLWTSLDWAKTKIPNAKSWPTDVAVPVSALPQMISETVLDIESHGLLTTVVGHVGDGNIHALVIFPEEKLADAETVVHNMVRRAIQYEGTVSGEHGVGIGKREFLEQELGPEAVNAMRRIKLALDPLRLLNPDKVFAIDPCEQREDHH